MLLEFRAQAEKALADALRALDHKPPGAPVRTWLEPSPHADLSTRVCFNLASKDPAKLAADVAARIRPSGLLGEVKAQGPYLNFSAAPAFHLQALKKILDEGDRYGSLNRAGRVVLEHTSANPDGPLHIGHLRNALLGDSLARILRRAGHEVQTHYYANDMGRQIGVLAWGLRHFEFNPGKKPDHAVAEVYIAANRALEKEPEKAGEVTRLLLKYEAREPDAVALFRRGVQRCLDGIRATLDRLGAVHDEVVWESQFAGEAAEILKEVEKLPGALRTPDGARGLALEGFEKELMLVRSDGTSLYASRDLAYHRWKGHRGAMIDVLGEDHKLYARQLAAALKLLKLPAPETVHFEFVSLPEGSMSTRAGTYVAVDDLLDQVEAEAQKQAEARRGAELDAKKIREISRAVALAAIRFDVLKVSAEKPTVFDWRTALDFEKRGGPFILYAHTRAAAILRKAAEQGLKPAPPEEPEAFGAPERGMVRELSRFRLVLEEAVELRRPHLVAVYAQEAAEKFNQFYRDVRVLQAPEALRGARLAVVAACGVVLRNALECLGIEAIEEM
ncbi:MAG: arginine--tRNA ligase [Halobacteria archaeon]